MQSKLKIRIQQVYISLNFVHFLKKVKKKKTYINRIKSLFICAYQCFLNWELWLHKINRALLALIARSMFRSHSYSYIDIEGKATKQRLLNG